MAGVDGSPDECRGQPKEFRAAFVWANGGRARLTHRVPAFASRPDQRLAELGSVEQRQECQRCAFQVIEHRHLGLQAPVLD